MISNMAASSEEKSDSFIKILMENVVNIREMCNKYKQSGLGIDEFAQRSLDKVDKLEETLKREVSNNAIENDDYIKECLQLYAQVLLDVTFCEENILVDGIFPEKNAKVRVHKLMSMMRQPEVICQHCFPDKCPKDLLGEEILECLLWRRGALLYMYCHTLQEDTPRLEKERKNFAENCKNGALYLKQMLQVRKPLKEGRENVVTNSDDVFTLLKKGVFTETHVLSMIYAGELCYWHIRHSKTTDPLKQQQTPDHSNDNSEENSSSDPPASSAIEDEKLKESTHPEKPLPRTSASSSEFNAVELGISVLSSYLDIIEGPLQNHCWSSERAKQILDYIEKYKKSQSEDVEQSEEIESVQEVKESCSETEATHVETVQ